MLRVLINGEEVVGNPNIQIKEEFLSTSSVILKNVYPKSWETDRNYNSRFYFPKDYSQCLIYFDDKLIFSGVVKNTGNISLSPYQPHSCDLQILSYKTFLSEGNTLDFVIANKTIEEAIQMVVDAVSSYGFEVGTIDIAKKDDVIGAYSTLDKSAYDVLQYLADISNSKWFAKRVNENTLSVNFYDPDKMPLANPIDYTKSYYEKNNIQDMSFSFSTNDYRNKQVMTSDQVFAGNVTTNTFTSNQYDTTFLLEKNVGKINRITVNGTTATFITKNEKDNGKTADFYYEIGSNSIESSITYSAGTIIEIEYVALVSGREIVINNEEINRIRSQLGINGNIARYEKRSDSTSSLELQSIGQSYIYFKGRAEVTLTLKTYYKDIFEIGQRVMFNAPIQELVDHYMVKSKTIDIVQVNDTQYIFYTYTLSNNFNAETAVNYFDNQRSKLSGNIEEGSSINRNIDIETTQNIFFSNQQIEDLGESSGVLEGVLGGVL